MYYLVSIYKDEIEDGILLISINRHDSKIPIGTGEIVIKDKQKSIDGVILLENILFTSYDVYEFNSDGECEYKSPYKYEEVIKFKNCVKNHEIIRG